MYKTKWLEEIAINSIHQSHDSIKRKAHKRFTIGSNSLMLLQLVNTVITNPIPNTEIKDNTDNVNSPSTVTTEPEEDKNQSSTDTAEPQQSAVPQDNQNKEVFYGQWVIKQVLAYGQYELIARRMQKA